jgi:hypothetical protein
LIDLEKLGEEKMAQWVIGLLVLLTGWAGYADAAALSLSAPSKTEAMESVGYPVQLHEDVLFMIHQRIRSFTPKERADAISRRLLSVAKDPFAETAEINISEGESSTDIVFGDRILMSVLDRDAQTLDRRTLPRSMPGRCAGVLRSSGKKGVQRAF